MEEGHEFREEVTFFFLQGEQLSRSLTLPGSDKQSLWTLHHLFQIWDFIHAERPGRPEGTYPAGFSMEKIVFICSRFRVPDIRKRWVMMFLT